MDADKIKEFNRKTASLDMDLEVLHLAASALEEDNDIVSLIHFIEKIRETSKEVRSLF